MKKYAYLAIIGAGFLAGCATPGDRNVDLMSWWYSSCESKDNAKDCYIEVSASLSGEGKCIAAIEKGQESIGFDKDAKDKKVEWRFTEEAEKLGFRFPRGNAIEPKASPPAPADNIANWYKNFKDEDTAGGKKYKLKNENDKAIQPKAIDYHYLVRVQLERNGMPTVVCTPLDPIIKNQR